MGQRKVVFMIDGWFMRKRVYQLKSFRYSGSEIRRYCLQHLKPTDVLYRIFYYDTPPLTLKGHYPKTGESIDFSKTKVAIEQLKLLDSIKATPFMALRLGHTVWQNNEWHLNNKRLKSLLKGDIKVSDLVNDDFMPLIKQKTVDMKIGIDIALIAIKKLANTLIIITGDADIAPALKLARREGMQVGLDPLHKPIKPELSEHVDYISSRIKIDKVKSSSP